MNDEKENLWNNFAATGSVYDYLKYKGKSDSKGQKEGQNGTENTGYNRERYRACSNGNWRG